MKENQEHYTAFISKVNTIEVKVTDEVMHNDERHPENSISIQKPPTHSSTKENLSDVPTPGTRGPGSTQTNQVEAKPSNNNVTKESEEEPPVVETSNKSDNDRLSREYGSEN